jgi:GH18 family chitinase
MADQPTSLPSVTPSPEPPRFRVVAYVTDAVVPAAIPYDKLTHINYAFLLPNEDGSFRDLANPWKVAEVVEAAHRQGVRVLISVGGWGWDAQFEAMASSADGRSAFVRNLAAVVAEYGLDGADIDWEYPDPGPSAQSFLALIRELRQALPAGKLLTAAVAAVGVHGEGVLPEAFPEFDFINLMVYDGGGPMHASMDYAQASFDFWLGRGLPPEKAVLGVPFYARPNEMPYRKIVELDPAAAQTDTFDYYGTLINYNGIPTIRAKTRLALERGSGIMFWTLEGDAAGDLSLLAAIHAAVAEARP